MLNKYKCYGWLLISVFPGFLMAESLHATSPYIMSRATQYDPKHQIIVLLITVAAIVICGWMLKKFKKMPWRQNADIQVISSHALGVREKIVLIQVGKQQLLIGVTPQNIQHLHTLAEPLITTPTVKPMPAAFSDFLKPLLNKEKNHE